MATALVACGPSATKSNGSGADSAQVETAAVEEDTAKEEDGDELADPQKLADFAVECYRTGDRARLLPHMTENGARKLREELATEEQMKGDKAYARALADMRETLDKTTYTCKDVTDMGAAAKQYSYKSKPSGYNLSVLLEQHDGRWLVDVVGPR